MVFHRRTGRRGRDGPRGAGRRAPTYAALDLGTNNCRLLVAEAARERFKVVDAFSRIVRLGEGMARTGRLSDAAQARALDALKVCAAKLRRRRIDGVRAVATEACRKADNCAAFLERVRDETGLAFETITPDEEARLALGGCLPLLDGERPHALVFDIGGGSTQLMWLDVRAERPSLVASLSIPAGVVSLSERYGTAPLSRGEYQALIDGVDSHLAAFCDGLGIREAVADDRVQMLGTSGTVTTLVGLDLGLDRYERAKVDGAFLDLDVVHALSDELRALDHEGRASRPCVGVERADLVVAGCAILEALCRRWPVPRLRVADRGVREGILLDLMAAGRGGAGLFDARA